MQDRNEQVRGKTAFILAVFVYFCVKDFCLLIINNDSFYIEKNKTICILLENFKVYCKVEENFLFTPV